MPLVAALLLGGCAVDETTTALNEESPPPRLGRPDWVQVPAEAGGYLGAAVGSVLSIAVLPLTFPISLIADEPLGYAKDQFLFLPVGLTASGGYFLLGAPFDVIDYGFRRAWTNEGRREDYHFDVQPPPIGPETGARGAAAHLENIDAPAKARAVGPGPAGDQPPPQPKPEQPEQPK